MVMTLGRWAVVILTLLSVLTGGASAQGGPPGADDEAARSISRALQLYGAGDCVAALPLSEKAVSLRRAAGQETADLGMALVVQALCLKRLSRVSDAERAYREAIEIYERTQGPNGRDLGVALDNLASLYMENERLDEAEKLRLRAIEIFKSSLGSAHPSTATALGNLAVLYQFQGRMREAEETFLQALDVVDKAFGRESRQAGIMVDNLAGLYRAQRQFDKAEPYYLRAVEILEKTLGLDHPDTGLALQNYAILLNELGKHEAAEANIKRGLAITERLYGPGHESVAAALNTLVLQYIEQSRWPEALQAAQRAAAINIELARQGKPGGPTEGGQKASAFRRLVQAAYGKDASDPTLANEGFVAAQRALDSEAASALSQLAARFSSRDPAFAQLVRERQDLVKESGERDKLLIAALSKPADGRDRDGEAALRSRMGAISSRLDAIDRELAAKFPDYAALARPVPLSIADVQTVLAPDEVLVQFIDLQTVGRIPETGFAWFITKTDVRWVRLPIGTAGIERAVATLRCGLDTSNWTDASGWPEATDGDKRRKSGQIARRERCAKLTGANVSDGDPPPFNLGTAHQLYEALFGGAQDLIKTSNGGKQLLVVASGALTSLPLQVLVTEEPGKAMPAMASEYGQAMWLSRRHAVTSLPSVASLKALRQNARTSQGALSYLAFGNPLLVGPDGSDKSAFAKQTCQPATAEAQARVAWVKPDSASTFVRGGVVDLAVLRGQVPLPDTADELCMVASELGAASDWVHLGARATESEVKRLSRDGGLAKARVVHFATHGLIASETESVDETLSEPALMLTPPDAANSDDDGLLTASEVSELKLDADWVVLSACNTAAGGEKADAEPLSGLARAFFYAGARALLVSHWYVDSRVAVAITTGAFAELKRQPAIGRAEALRRSMLAAMSDPKRPTSWTPAAHPAVWAPFTIVGEGGASGAARSAQAKAKKKVVRKQKPKSTWDWLTDTW
jgi:CHAT domain-containing protein/tetratricopeptide (TPR) repeat protein